MLLALCITLCAGVWASARSAALSGSLVRLHVVAVSDDTEEQAIKLRVRDSVLAYLEPRLEGVQDAAGARELIGSELDGIRSAAETAAETESALETLGGDSAQLLSGEGEGVVFKFRLLELWGELMEYLGLD